MVPGAIWSVLVVGGLVIARQAAKRAASPRLLASMSVWQIALVPVLGFLTGVGIGTLIFLLGPGF